MSEGMDKPKKEGGDFHETDYYSKFHEQEASLEKKGDSGDPSGEIDEDTIQELMDATLTGGSIGSDSTDLDTGVKADWTEGPPQPDSPTETLGDPKPLDRTLSPRKTIRRKEKGVVGKRKQPRRKKRWWRSRGQIFGVLKFFLFAILLAGLVGSIWFIQVNNRNVYADLQAEAGEKHSSGDYYGAIEKYGELMNLAPKDDWYQRTRLSFLTGAAYEENWKEESGSPADFDEAISHYNRVIEMDEGEMRVYGVEAMLAKSEMLIERSRTMDSEDDLLFAEGKGLLEELVNNPAYSPNPTVHKGVPHRRLADLIREEDPMRAIALLGRARSNQGDLEEGYENLEIGLIYRDLLEDPDQAVEFFERARQNELAPREVKNLSDELLKLLIATDIENPNLYAEEMLDFFPEEEVGP